MRTVMAPLGILLRVLVMIISLIIGAVVLIIASLFEKIEGPQS